jgi:hypothetical protein
VAGTVRRRQVGLHELAGLAPLDVLAGNGPPADGGSDSDNGAGASDDRR